MTTAVKLPNGGTDRIGPERTRMNRHGLERARRNQNGPERTRTDQNELPRTGTNWKGLLLTRNEPELDRYEMIERMKSTRAESPVTPISPKIVP